MKRIYATFLAALLIATIAPACQGQYVTDWVANTFGTNATRVGNVALPLGQVVALTSTLAHQQDVSRQTPDALDGQIF